MATVPNRRRSSSRKARRAPSHRAIQGALVVGADQLLVSGDDWLDKPSGREAARTSFQKLRGRCHLLVSGMVVVRDEAVLCRHVEVAELAMRDYSDRFIQWYLDWAQDADLQVVGACRLEGPGAQAFRPHRRRLLRRSRPAAAAAAGVAQEGGRAD